MIVNRLRKSILLFAIQGKLTKQNLAIENTLKEFSKDSEFYSSSKIDDKPFDIPENWAWTKISTLIKFGNGEKINGIEHKYLDVKFLRGKSNKEFKNNGRYIKPGTKIILVDGENSGEVFVVHEEGYMGSTFRTLELKYDHIWEYLKVYLDLHSETLKNNKIGSAIPHLNKQLFNNLLVPVPPFNEQQRILKKLQELLPLLDSLEEHESNLNNLIKNFPEKISSSILLSAMEGKLTESSSAQNLIENEFYGKLNLSTTNEKIDDYNYNYPKNWPVLDLDKVCVLSTGNSINETIKRTKYINKINGYSYIGTKDVKYDNSIDYNNGVYIPFDEDFRVAKKNSTILCIEGGSAGRKVGLLDRDVCYGNKLVSIYSEIMDPKFIFYFISSPVFKNQFYDLVSGIIGGVGISKIKKIKIPIPPLNVQKQIVKKLDEILPNIRKIIHV
jgi:type I restriction enzyme S subunit